MPARFLQMSPCPAKGSVLSNSYSFKAKKKQAWGKFKCEPLTCLLCKKKKKLDAVSAGGLMHSLLVRCFSGMALSTKSQQMHEIPFLVSDGSTVLKITVQRGGVRTFPEGC